MPIRHRFHSAVPDNPQVPERVRPSNWNDTHDIAAFSHTELQDIGVNTHIQIDTHLALVNQHIDHSAVTITGAGLLVGQGGDLTANRVFTINNINIDHGGLSGLADDDHLQYLLIDGSRDMTGGLTIDGSADEIQLLVQGNGTQTSDLLVLEQSDGTDVFTVDNDGNTIIGDGGAGDSIINWRVNDSVVYIEGIDDSDSDNYKIAGATGFGIDDLITLDTSGNLVIAGNTYFGGLIVPSGTVPTPNIVGSLFLDTDAGANGTLVIYSNGAWRNVAVL